MGQRIAKHVYNSDWMLEKSTYYLLDAQGNTMSTYDHEVELAAANVDYTLKERQIYGSARLGMHTAKVDMYEAQLFTRKSEFDCGERQYELSNHLGNVLAVFSDIKVPQSSNQNTVDGYQVNLVSTADYSPFGVQLDGRTSSSNDYRYGFQGQEKDDETGLVNYKYRMHDPRIGRFFAVDPLAPKYPHNGPYNFSENRVIDGVELEGLEVVVIRKGTSADLFLGTGETAIGVAFGPDGVAGVGSYSYGVQAGSLAGINTNVSITFFPDMPSVKDVGGDGNTLELTAGVPVGPQFSTAAVESGDYTGISYKAGYGATHGLPVSISYTWDKTKVLKFGDEEKKALQSALPVMNSLLEDTNNQLSNLYKDNRNIVEKRDSYLNEDGKMFTNDPNYDTWKNLNDKVKSNNENIKKLKDTKKMLNQVIDASKS